MLDVTPLRVLVAVARHGSVTAAARELNYAQPSVSHHLARLEAETGVRLIQRAGRGIRLTDAGRLLADRAAEVLGRLHAGQNELAAHAGLRAGRVRLAAFPSALGTIVPAAAAMLQAGHPGMDLRLTEAEPPEALRMLRAGYVDVALVFRHVQVTGGSSGPELPAAGPGRGGPPRAAVAAGAGAPDHPAAVRRRFRADGRRPGPVRAVPVDRGLRPVPDQPDDPVLAGRVHAEDLVHHRRLRGRPGAGGGGAGGGHATRPCAEGRAD